MMIALLPFLFSAALADDFSKAKAYLSKNLDLFDNKTIYCGCTVSKKRVDLKSCNYKIQDDPKRARRLEWEHVVPAEAFGQSFADWRSGADRCIRKGKKFKGRKCARLNPEFEKIEGDLYNLFPEIGELNGLRQNYSMAAISGSPKKFGGCLAKIEDRKFEPMDFAKGVVARTYLNLDHRYPGRGIVSEKNQKLFEAWDKMYPVTPLECKRWSQLEGKMRYPHLFKKRCK